MNLKIAQVSRTNQPLVIQKSLSNPAKNLTKKKHSRTPHPKKNNQIRMDKMK